MFKKKIFSTLSAVMMIVMVGASLLPTLTALAVTNTRSEDLIFQKDSTGNVVAILSKNGLVTPIGNVLVIYNASGVATGIKTIYGEVIAISGGSYTLPVASSSVLGGIKLDGITITVNPSGVASATASGASNAGTLTGTTLASNVTASSLLSAAGGSFGSAAYTAISNYLGAASNAVSASAVPIAGVTGLGTGVASAAANATNSANGLAGLDSNARLPEAQMPSTVPPITGTPVAGYKIVVSAVSPTLSLTYAADTATALGEAQSSASTAVTLTTAYLNTSTPNYSTGASAAVWTVPLVGSMAANVGDKIYVVQSDVGGVAISSVPGVTVLSENNWLRIRAQHTGVVLQNIGVNFWRAIGALAP